MFVSFWLGGILLAGTAIVSYYLQGRFFGVSSYWERVLWWRETQDGHDAAEQMQSSEEMNAELQAETAELLASLPEEERAAVLAAMAEESESSDSDSASNEQEKKGREPPLYYACFLLGILLGGLLVNQLYLGLSASELPPSIGLFKEITSPFMVYGLLVFGGVLIGFGTRMLSGCTSGHGLIGCSALQPASLLATALFFGTAIATSIAIQLWVAA